MDVMYRDERVVSDRTVDSHVKKLRRKIAAVVPDQEVIHSVYGLGYKYELNESEAGSGR
jgi:two-component system response regulator BaeR